jgi:hypothetical protein
MTAAASSGDRRRTEAAGLDYHLVMPVHPDALTKLLSSSSPNAT